MKKPKLLWIAHGNIETGFGRVTQNILGYLQNEWDIACLAIGYTGDPHGKPYRMYPAGNKGDQWGLNRLEEVYRIERPDVFMFLMEPWNIIEYVRNLRAGLGSRPKIVAYSVVDGENMKGDHADWLSQCDVTIFPTAFACDQAKKAGYHGYAFEIPHGVNPQLYRPCDKQWARKQIGLGNLCDPDAFIIGNVNMNQPRKRIDISVEAFALFLEKAGQPKEPLLYLHMRRNEAEGWDIGNLAKIFDVKGRVTLTADELQINEESMRYIYNAMDIQISTTSGEGFGLSHLEGMACGTPQIVPDFAALGEWAKPACITVEAKERTIMSKQQNVVRYVPKADDMAEAMLELYKNPDLRKQLSKMGRRHALQDCYRWSVISAGFDEALRKAIAAKGMSGTLRHEPVPVGPSGAALAQEQR